MKESIIELEFPDKDAALDRAMASLEQVHPSEQCHCVHLQALLPNRLSLEVCRATDGSLLLKNPIHALHLTNHLQEGGKLPGNTTILQNCAILYGPEQERLFALKMEGIPKEWHPLITEKVTEENDDTPIKEESLSNGQPLERQQAVPDSVMPPNRVLSIDVPQEFVLSSAGTKVIPPDVSSASAVPTKELEKKPEPQPVASSGCELRCMDEGRFEELQKREELIQQVRDSLLSKRSSPIKKKLTPANKKKKTSDYNKSSSSESSKNIESALLKVTKKQEVVAQLTDVQEKAWYGAFRGAQTQLETLMEHFRWSRQEYWQRQKRPRDVQEKIFGIIQESDVLQSEGTCSECFRFSGDEVMRCLQCPFIGCAPHTLVPGSNDHMIKHFVQTNHRFAVSCGPRAKVYCLECDEIVHHLVFDLERERVDIAENLPWFAWKEHPIQRSFDALQFFQLRDVGILWKGMMAAYPLLVPKELLAAAKLSRFRQILFHGETESLPYLSSSDAKEFNAAQKLKVALSRWKISAPVGMYNLGNTCFQSAILQCVIHCRPLQRYFLRDVRHHFASCAAYRSAKSSSTSHGSTSKQDEVCLACEMDKMFVSYYGSTIGQNVLGLLEREAASANSNGQPKASVVRGDPLITAEMLTAAWKCGGMNYLAGYEQRDAHEFFHGFIEVLGKHAQQYHDKVTATINKSTMAKERDTQKHTKNVDPCQSLFEGKLRSVLICQECGNKRSLSEPFVSISLPLSKEVQKLTTVRPGESSSSKELSVERCLRHFTLPETLSDPVDCPSCKQKTTTKKQHVISRLPTVLCLHLKRFDAAQNKKIEDFVSFPADGLNMGTFLPHWCEVTRALPAPKPPGAEDFTPEIKYSLFATVNHFGNLQSGHYVTNVKVDGKWYHCNDAHVCDAGEGDGEKEVLRSDGAYLLFYIRQNYA